MGFMTNKNYLLDLKGLIFIITIILSMGLISLDIGFTLPSESPLEWSVSNDRTQWGTVILTPEDSSVTIPIIMDIPLYGVLNVNIKTSGSDFSLYNLPLKYTYSGLEPKDEFIPVNNITSEYTNNENRFWVNYQRIKFSNNEINFTLSLSMDWQKELVLDVYLTSIYSEIKFDETNSSPYYPKDGIGVGSNQTFTIGFYNQANSTNSYTVNISNYNEIADNNFTVFPGEYIEIAGRTIEYDIWAPYEEHPTAKFNISVSCDLEENISGFIIWYPTPPFVFLEMGNVGGDAPGFEMYAFFSSFLILMIYLRFFKKGERKL